MLRELILKNRSYRRFVQSIAVSEEQLQSWVDLGRLSASGRNAQPLKYILSNDASGNERIFSTLAWAGYLTDWVGPVEGERPAAYLIQMLDNTIANQFFCDDGVAAQSILLAAVEAGFGGCIFRSINKPKLTKLLGIPSRYEIINVIALGKPLEEVQLEPMVDGDYKYWRDERGVHHVPKRSLDEVIVKM